MTLSQMLYYKTVCEYMNLTKAAAVLHLTQPALSASIREMENECGVALFRHNANSISITDEGIVLLEEIEGILQQYEHLEGVLHSQLLNRRYLRIGLSTMRGNVILPELIGRFRQQHENIRLFITEGATITHYDNLDQNKVDLIIVGSHPRLTPEEWENSPVYGRIELSHVDMAFAVNVHHPLAGRGEVSWADIAGEQLIMLDNRYSVTQSIREQMHQAGYELPSGVYTTSQIYTIERFVEKNAAAGFLPMEAIRSNPAIVGLRYPSGENHIMYQVYRRDRHRFIAVQQFIDTAREMMRERAK